jgi:hypothetical protein
MKAASDRPPIVVDATVKTMPGDGLRCLYNTTVAGLQLLGHPLAAELNTVPKLRGYLSEFLSGPMAALVRITQSGESLTLAAQREGTTLAEMYEMFRLILALCYVPSCPL